MLKPRPVIIDTDPGIDDAVAIAIALFSEQLDIRLITTVSGNVEVEKTTANVLKLLKFFDRKVPVAAGATRPLIQQSVPAKNVHGESGMDGWDFEPGDKSNLLEDSAVDALRKIILSSKEPITLVAIAPLTNIALLFRMYPEVKNNIRELVMMGGTTGRGNFTVMGEFNAATDPEATRIVFEFGVPIVMLGLDVGWKALVYPEASAKIKQFNHTGEMIFSLFQHYRSRGLANGLKMYDSCAMAYLLKPEMFTMVETYVGIETKGEFTLGMTVVDLKGYLNRPNNAKVAVDIDSAVFQDWLLNSLKKCS